MSVYLGIAFFLILAEAGSALNYSAVIDIAGFKGQVHFSPEGSTGMSVAVTLEKPSGVTTDLTSIEIMQFPAMFGQFQDAQQVCTNLGGSMRQLTGVTAGAANTVTGLTENDVFHRSVRINGFSKSICATILPVGGNVETRRAKFMGPIAGEVWMRKRTPMNGLFIFSNLAYANNRADPTGSSTVRILSYATGSLDDTNFAARCASLTSGTEIVASLTIGNSAASAGKRQATFSASLSSISFSVIALEVSGNIVACADVRSTAQRTSSATFHWDNVRGHVTMTQASPFDVTRTAISLSGLQHLPVAYHVHKFPVPQRVSGTDDRCSDANVAGHFNPYGVVVADSPVGGTSDQYEIGDLSGKYGHIGVATYQATFMDWNLPLFGVNSVTGRSIVIHRSGGSRWVCATIDYPGAFRTAVVNFRYPAFGAIYFRQVADRDQDTIIWGKLSNMNGSTSNAHNFHVHVDPVAADCGSAGPHYNPSQVSLQGNYAAHCSASDPFVCELGDLSQRLGPINIDGKPFFSTDPYLPLFGPYNVIGRSIVVHGANRVAPRYVCGNITMLREVVLETGTGTWRGDNNDGSVSGSMRVSQKSDIDPSLVTSSITGLSQSTSSYKIHGLPVNSQGSGVTQCQTSAVGGVFNPYSASSTPSTGQTHDKYAVGDLSGKYGISLTALTSQSSPQRDHNLPLLRNVGISGRSVVIYKSGTGAPAEWKCQNLNLAAADQTGHVIRARASFADVTAGYVDFTQVVYEDGSASPTLIDVKMAHSGTQASQTTNNHNWHIHLDPVLNQAQCSIALGHYNPYNAPIGTPSYSSTCGAASHLGCEVGDLSSKHEKYNIGANTAKHFIDDDVPLHTDKTVLGRSVVFHVKDAGAPRLTCANIEPLGDQSNTFTVAFASSVTYDHFRFTAAVASALTIPRMRVVVIHNTNVPVTGHGCAKVMVHIAGPSLTAPQQSTLLQGSSSALGPYKATGGHCVNQKGLQVTGLTQLTGASPAVRTTLFVPVICALMSKFLRYLWL